jgi:3-methylcrotonyl-CoA carboxylase alpha subunit
VFKKILIANRGEIACRIIATARRLGVRTAAIYSDADAGARHVRLADEAYRIGPAVAAESYLNGTAIIDLARQVHAEAIHPGYGFLSENAEFATAVSTAGITFIGPPAAAIRAMGAKQTAKQLMTEAGVPLLPGYHGPKQGAEFLMAQAQKIGYPVLLKACAGGGGRGMRRVDTSADFLAALAACKREALSAFGDDQVLLEKYLEQPRHIEIQIFADTHGNIVHLFERDCSVQRRYQKVIEEAPAPGLSQQRRTQLGQAAIAAARAVDYVGAGTVEFIVQPDGQFYFMEMNTRLQVEHPVTEMITGLDLVAWQLQVAAGAPLPLSQDQITIKGHAIEARIYAEDPQQDFLPSAGRLLHCRLPESSATVRIDSAVEQGDVVTHYYDAMLAKLIVHGSDRAAALRLLQQALMQCQIVGVNHNIEFLKRVAATDSFSSAQLDTALIERQRAALFAAPPSPEPDIWRAVALVEARRAKPTKIDSPWQLVDGWRLGEPAPRVIRLRWQDTIRSISINNAILSQPLLKVDIIARDTERHVFFQEQFYLFHVVEDEAAVTASESLPPELRAPLPGKVVALHITPGTSVKKNTPLLVLEAMKMEHTLRAPDAGVVRGYHCTVGEQIAAGKLLIDFDTISDNKS